MRSITIRAARRFLLLKHGLLGRRRFIGKEGAVQFVRQCGCIQYDPVDACGRNAELTLQSRVQGFSKAMLQELLYRDRALFDYPDKELAIMAVEDWPYFARYRTAARACGRQFEGLAELEERAAAYILQNGPVDANSLPIAGKIHWHSAIHWSGNWHGESNAARSVLEQMYSDGRLMIHHKDGARKSYDLTARCLPASLREAPDPLPDAFDHARWRILRRIGAVGLLHDRNSDALLGIHERTTQLRAQAFSSLLQEGRITAVQMESARSPLYLRSEDLPLLDLAESDAVFPARCEFIAPLDPLLWDRKLIQEIFDFSYRWEIYTPAAQRKYGYYVLPIVYGEGLIGRIDATARYKESVLEVKNVWWEPSVRRTKKLDAAVQRAVKRFAEFNGCREIRDDR
ncbi:MAG: YcaQ family DNA glycosylase [Clostridia bacterium]|nr:YcaQ family DNA glycosylase [Clostridia bacterium]